MLEEEMIQVEQDGEDIDTILPGDEHGEVDGLSEDERRTRAMAAAIEEMSRQDEERQHEEEIALGLTDEDAPVEQAHAQDDSGDGEDASGGDDVVSKVDEDGGTTGDPEEAAPKVPDDGLNLRYKQLERKTANMLRQQRDAEERFKAWEERLKEQDNMVRDALSLRERLMKDPVGTLQNEIGMSQQELAERQLSWLDGASTEADVKRDGFDDVRKELAEIKRFQQEQLAERKAAQERAEAQRQAEEAQRAQVKYMESVKDVIDPKAHPFVSRLVQAGNDTPLVEALTRAQRKIQEEFDKGYKYVDVPDPSEIILSLEEDYARLYGMLHGSESTVDNGKARSVAKATTITNGHSRTVGTPRDDRHNDEDELVASLERDLKALGDHVGSV